jgi:uncharacterized membrane protein
MMDDDTSVNRPPSPKAERAPGPTEAELSRIAREAVHQAPDARLDKQLARMGLLDTFESAKPQTGQPTSRPAPVDPELQHLREALQRTKAMLWVLITIVVILAVGVVVLLIR